MTTLYQKIETYTNSQLPDLAPTWASERPEGLNDLTTGVQLEGALYCLHSYRSVAQTVDRPETEVRWLIGFVNLWRKCVNTVTEQQGKVLWNIPLQLRSELVDLPKETVVEILNDLINGEYGNEHLASVVSDYKYARLNDGSMESEIGFLATALKSLGEQIQYDKLNEDLSQRFRLINDKLKSLRNERDQLLEFQGACMA